MSPVYQNANGYWYFNGEMGQSCGPYFYEWEAKEAYKLYYA